VVAIIFPSWNYGYFPTLGLQSFDWNILAASAVFGFIPVPYYLAKTRNKKRLG